MPCKSQDIHSLYNSRRKVLIRLCAATNIDDFLFEPTLTPWPDGFLMHNGCDLVLQCMASLHALLPLVSPVGEWELVEKLQLNVSHSWRVGAFQLIIIVSRRWKQLEECRISHMHINI